LPCVALCLSLTQRSHELLPVFKSLGCLRSRHGRRSAAVVVAATAAVAGAATAAARRALPLRAALGAASEA